MAEGFTYFRDHDDTLCRLLPQGQPEVWWPSSKEWAPYLWDSRSVVPITEERVEREYGGAAVRCRPSE